MALHIFLVYSPQDWLSLFLLALAPLNVQALLLLGVDEDTFKASKTLKRVQKYYPDQFDRLLQKTVFLQECDLTAHLSDSNILINNNYYENNYLQHYEKGVATQYDRLKDWLSKQRSVFQKVVTIRCIYDQPVGLQVGNESTAGEINVFTGFIAPCLAFPSSGWLEDNGYFSQLILAIGEEVLETIPDKA